MGSATITRPAGHALGLLLAPARWLERARGRRRVALLAMYSVVGAVLWWAMSLNRLPDVGDPFDVRAASHVDVPEEANAIVLYKQAAAKLHRLGREDFKLLASNPTWRGATPEVRRWVVENREAMELFRLGSERPSSLYYQPGEVTYETMLPLPQDLREFARLAPLEAARLAEGGDLAGAWTWLRALIRASRHVGAHGTIIERLVGIAMLSVATGPASNWAADPRTGAPLLRVALRDVVACEAMAPRTSDMLKVEYMAMMKAIAIPKAYVYSLGDGTSWYRRLPGAPEVELTLRREPERSRRVIRLVFGNWLAYCDRPRDLRPPLIPGNVDLFDAGPTTSTAARTLDRESLVAWFKSSWLAAYFLPASTAVINAADRDRANVATLEITLAEQLYLRENGTPPSTLGDLLGPDLPHLPAGREPGEPSSLAPNP